MIFGLGVWLGLSIFVGVLDLDSCFIMWCVVLVFGVISVVYLLVVMWVCSIVKILLMLCWCLCVDGVV